MANDLSLPTSDPIANKPKKDGDPLENLCSDPWIRLFTALITAISGSPSRQNSSNLTAQSASIAATDISGGSLSAGYYSLSWYGEITTAAGVSSSLQVQVSWTSNGVAKTFTGTALTTNTTASYLSESVPLLYSDGGSPITYAINYASNAAGAMKFLFSVQLNIVQT